MNLSAAFRRALVAIFAAGLLLAQSGCAPRRKPAAPVLSFMKGFNYGAYAADVPASPRSDRALRQLRRTGAEWWM